VVEVLEFWRWFFSVQDLPERNQWRIEILVEGFLPQYEFEGLHPLAGRPNFCLGPSKSWTR